MIQNYPSKQYFSAVKIYTEDQTLGTFSILHLLKGNTASSAVLPGYMMMPYMSTCRKIKCVEEVRSFHFSVQLKLIKIRVKCDEEVILLSVFQLKYPE